MLGKRGYCCCYCCCFSTTSPAAASRRQAGCQEAWGSPWMIRERRSSWIRERIIAPAKRPRPNRVGANRRRRSPLKRGRLSGWRCQKKELEGLHGVRLAEIGAWNAPNRQKARRDGSAFHTRKLAGGYVLT